MMKLASTTLAIQQVKHTLPLATTLAVAFSIGQPSPGQIPDNAPSHKEHIAEIFGVDEGFRFSPPSQVIQNSATDTSSLNQRPAAHRIISQNGRFRFKGTDERIRFFGVNLSAQTAFPPKDQAARLAQILASLGINIVRLHHLDNEWGRPYGDGSLWLPEGPHNQFNPETLDRLDYFVHQLKVHGIYCNLNLKVSKHLNESDGIDNPSSIPFTHQKRADRFDPDFIQHQKWFAETLLQHHNPYTELTYAQDPAIALIEISNENSIMHLWPDDPLGKELEKLGEPYASSLEKRWNKWLKQSYATHQALQTTWYPNSHKAPTPKTTAPWRTNQINEAKASVTPRSASEPRQGFRASVSESTGTAWHAQSLLPIESLAHGHSYTLTFTASSPSNQQIVVSLMADASYQNTGLNKHFKLTSDPKTYQAVFEVTKDTPTHLLAFSFGTSDGELQVSDIKFSTANANDPTGSLADGYTIPKAGASKNIWQDWLTFLADTDRAFSEDMRLLVRAMVGDKPIIDSQIQWGGTTAISREQPTQNNGSNFVDTHYYWQHPQFPKNAPWNTTKWSIKNTGMVEAMARGELGPLALAQYRIAKSPFSVSEIDQAAPSDWAIELVPVITTFAAAQDWDAVYWFDAGDPVNQTSLNNFFDHLNHVAKVGQWPAAARIFRQNLIPPTTATCTLHTPQPLWKHHQRFQDAWNHSTADADQPPLDALAAINHRLAITPDATASSVHRTIQSGDSPLGFSSNNGGLWIAESPLAVCIVGHLGDAPITAGGIMLQTSQASTPGDTPSSPSFGSISVVTLDGKPLVESKHILVTAISRAQNQAMGWNENRTSVGNQWGHGPMLVQTPEMTLKLPQGNLTAYPLSPDGSRRAPITLHSPGTRLTLSPTHQTIYYELVSE